MPVIKRLLGTALLLVLIPAMAGCLPMPGSKTRGQVSSSSDLNSTNEEVRNYINLAAALLMQNEHTMALKELEKAKAIDPRNVDMENYFGLAYYGMNEYGLSVESFQKALAMRPERTDIRNNLGLAYLAQKQYDKALEEFNACTKDLAYEKKYMPMTNIGLAYLETGRYDEALKALNKVTSISPNYGRAYQLIGKTYIAKGNYRDAVDYLNNAAKLNPDDADTFMALGDTFARLNRPEESAEAYSRVTSLVPNTPIALDAQKKARQVMGFE